MSTDGLTDALSETLAVFDEGAPLTTTDVADRLDLGRRSTYDRLDRLAERGHVETKKVGASARVWWRSGHGAQSVPASSATGRAPVDDVLAEADLAVFVLDDAMRVAWLNEAAERYFGLDRDRVLGRDKCRLIEEQIAPVMVESARFTDRVTTTYEDNTFPERFRCYVTAGDGRAARWLEHRSRPIEAGTYAGGRIELYHDITDRPRTQRLPATDRRREREQYETIVETVDDGIYVLDSDHRFTMVNSGFLSMTGYDRAELVGSHAETVFGEKFVAIANAKQAELERAGDAVAVLEETLYPADGEAFPVESRFTPYQFADAATGRVGTVRDVREQKAHERELEDRVRQLEVVTDLGQYALATQDVDAVMERVTEEVAATLDTDFCKVLDLDESADELLLRHGVGWDEGLVGRATVWANEVGSQAAYTLDVSEPVVVEDLSTESRFDGPALLTDHGVRSGISTLIGPTDSPWGVLGVHDRTVRHFSENDAHFVQSVANILAVAIERHETEATLERQREQLAALNSLNETINETTASIIEQSTREEIETTVCEHLAASDSYCFAWTADTDPTSGTVLLRTEAGVEGYLDGVTLSVDPADDSEIGPAARAIRTGEIQTVQDCQHDPGYEPWHEIAAEYGFRSSAAIPISHEGTVYGALNVYAARPNAFDGQEREVIGQLGEVVGHAIAAIQRKRALMNDEMVELDFRIESVFESFGIDAQTNGTVRIDRAVPIGDETFLLYGHATPDAVEMLEALVVTIPHWESIEFREGSGERRFQLRVCEPPVLSELASLGGAVERAVIEDGTYWMTLAVSPGVDVRSVIATVQNAYPVAELRRRRQVERPRPGSADGGDRPGPDLTDRQRTTLEVAYRRGYFEWPRAAAGETVADALDIAPSTFHQHLRKAQQKLVTGHFADGA